MGKACGTYVVLGLTLALAGCRVTLNPVAGGAAGGGSGSTVTLKSGSADGSGDSAITNDADTSVIVKAASGSAWNEFLVDLGAQFKKENICAGNTIFGRVGTAACAEFFDHSLRDKGDTVTRLIPDVTKDTDGIHDGQVDKVNHSVLLACGTTQAEIDGDDGRIADCAKVNGTAATWDGAAKTNNGSGVWKLVTKTANGNLGKEVWRDERTKLLWSDDLGNLGVSGYPTGGQSQQYFAWCFASGNTQNEGGIDCTTGTVGSYNRVGVSLCAEDAGLLTPDGAHNADQEAYAVTAWVESGTAIIDAKGGMKLAATSTSPSVTWRLPTRGDFIQAYANGALYVLPRFVDQSWWTSSLSSDIPAYAWTFYAASIGYFMVFNGDRAIGNQVRCVGR